MLHSLTRRAVFAAALALLAACRTEQPPDTPPTPPVSPELQAAAPWLTPPPAGSTPRQVRQWHRKQGQAMVNATLPARSKCKNCGNDQSKTKQRDIGNTETTDRSKRKDQRKEKPRIKTKSKVRQGYGLGTLIKASLGVGALGIVAGVAGLAIYRRRQARRS